MWRVACLALAFALISPASAQDAPRARLLTRPDAQAMSDVFPPVALARGVSGRAVLSCDVAADGAAVCRAVEQAPDNLGFGAAAEALSANWRFEPIASTVRIPVEFQNESSETLVQSANQLVDAVDGIDPATYANADYERISAAYDELAACAWGGRLDCLPPGQALPDVARNLSRYPESARIARLEGRALIACAIRSDRRADCVLDSATDPIFGDAGLQLVNDIVARHGEHLPPGVAFRVPVDFAMRDLDDYRRSPWSERPSAQDFARAYPSRAMSQRRDGRSVMICTIRADRRIDCVADTEEPADQGFGAAAVEVSRGFRIAPEYLGQPGYAPGDRIRVPISFRIS